MSLWRDVPWASTIAGNDATVEPDVINPYSPLNDSNHGSGPADKAPQLGIVESVLLRFLDRTLKQHWNLGQNILLCWTQDALGVQFLVAPHFFLGNFTSSLTDCAPVDRLEALNGSFVRALISGPRYLPLDEFQGAASRLELIPLQVELPVQLILREAVVDAIDSMVRRYSITYVKSRAVLLFDIVNFSLVAPFEQTSQLNSLSYSLNSAHSKLRQNNIEVNFSRTTTGDGYYVWHQDDSPRGNMELFQFMLLVLADNAIAQRSAKPDRIGQTVPKIRTGFHLGSHFEFYQVEGLKPGMNSFIVGDVTIELARMLDIAAPGQVFIGDFQTQVPTSGRESAYLITADTVRFVERATRQLQESAVMRLSGKQIKSLHCFLTGVTGASGGQSVRRFRITDKHGLSRNAYNLRVNIRVSDSHIPIILGLQENYLPNRGDRWPATSSVGRGKGQSMQRGSNTGLGFGRKRIKKTTVPVFDD